MTTTQAARVEVADKLLEMHPDLTAEDLVSTFVEWLDEIGDIHFVVEAVGLLEEIDPAMRVRAAQLSTMLDRAADLVAAVAMTRIPGLTTDMTNAGTMARGVFEAITRGPDLRVSLLDPALL